MLKCPEDKLMDNWGMDVNSWKTKQLVSRRWRIRGGGGLKTEDRGRWSNMGN